MVQPFRGHSKRKTSGKISAPPTALNKKQAEEHSGAAFCAEGTHPAANPVDGHLQGSFQTPVKKALPARWEPIIQLHIASGLWKLEYAQERMTRMVTTLQTRQKQLKMSIFRLNHRR